MPNLTKYQCQHIVELLERGEDLPLDYKHLLFPPERKEYELVYAGKEREEDILAETMGVPLQPLKTFGNVEESDWHNMLIFGDNLQAMKTLWEMKKRGELVNADGSYGVKLVYIDPPFATRQEFQGDKGERAYGDKLIGARFVEFLRRRLVLLRELLTSDGSIYVHLDEKKSHYIKVILDEVLGEHNFQREIVWRIGWVSGFKTQAKNWIRNHDVVLFYTKGAQFVFNKIYIPYPDGYVRRDGSPPTGPGYPIEDTWNCYQVDRLDSIQIMSFSGEKTGFPTQKNENLLERIIRASSDEGDIVLDAFVGSGTTLAVAEKLGRRWIGIDTSKLAIYTTQKRLLSLRENIGNTGDPLPPKPFTLYNAGLYDFSKLKRLPWEDWRFFALHLFQCRDEPHTVGGVELDGYRGADDVLVFNHLQYGGVVLDYGFVDDLHNQIGGKVGSRFFIIAPAASVIFLEDYIDKGRTRYYVLRIPYSIINELHTRDFEAITQPVDESQVNETVEAVGFDFIRLPEVVCEYLVRPREGELINEAVIQIRTFKSKAMVKGATQKGNLETLSMVMVDYDYPFKKPDDKEPPPFEPDQVFYASEIEKNGWEVRLPLESLGQQAMIIYMDIYGNEYREIKTPADFRPVADETNAEETANA